MLPFVGEENFGVSGVGGAEEKIATMQNRIFVAFGSLLLKLWLISLTLAELEQIVLMIEALKTKRQTLGMIERKTTEAQR